MKHGLTVWVSVVVMCLVSGCSSPWDDAGEGVEWRLLGFGESGSVIRDAHYADMAVYLTSTEDQGIRCAGVFEYRLGGDTLCAFGMEHWSALRQGDSVQYRLLPERISCDYLEGIVSGCSIDSSEKVLLTVAVHAVYDSSNYTESPRYQRYLRQAKEAELIREAIERDGLVAEAFEWMGIWQVIQQEGEGMPPKQGEEVAIAYEGRFLNGTVFDDARDSLSWLYYPYGKPDQVVRGFELAISKMRPGERRTVWLTSDLAFGERGSEGIVPPNTPLVYDLTLRAVYRSDSTALGKNPS